MPTFLRRFSSDAPLSLKLADCGFWLRASSVGVILLAFAFALTLPRESAQTSYYRHTFFDNGPQTAGYAYSSGKAVAPSTLEFAGKRLPLDGQIFFTPPNSLRIAWQSNPGGAWIATVHVLEFRDREILFAGDSLSFWLYSAEAIPAASLPDLRLHDTKRGFSIRLHVGEFSGNIPAKKWVRVNIPLARGAAESVTSFDPHRLAALSFEQAAADSRPHALFLDEVRIGNLSHSSAAAKFSLAAPKNLQAHAY